MDFVKFALLAALIALATLPAVTSAQAVISIEPQSQTVYEPDNVYVRVEADSAAGLYGFQLSLMFDSSCIEYQGVSEGGLLSQGNPSNVFCIAPNESTDSVSNYACTRVVSGNASESGVMAVFNFSVVSPGESSVNLSGIKLSNMYSENISCSHSNGSVTTAQCQEGENVSCGPLNETGQCKFGNRTCVSGVLQACEYAVFPSEEVCNGIDDDCTGTIDDIDGDDSAASTHCHCYGGASPLDEEACPHNGIDDDCDGEIDENECDDNGGGGGGCTNGQTRSCSGSGICQPAYETCSGGVWGTCIGSRAPTSEVCNGIDDDCDGLVDDGADCCTSGQTRECGPSNEIGECVKGTSTCSNGIWGSCVGAVNPTADICDGLDNDCNGVADDGCDADSCGEGAVPAGGCMCEGQFHPDGYCCSGLYFGDGCPFSWVVLIYAGVIILIVLYALVFYFRRHGEELSWETLKSKY
jgi:hypothetical protein